MPTEKMDQQIKLQDGRALGFAEYGDPKGAPVFYFHGFPSSRLDYLFFDDGQTAAGTHARIIAADRPGYGLSDAKPGRGFLDWPDDLTELADALEISRFAVLGVSGGGPYAAACAHKIPSRLTATGIVCGMGPSDAPGMVDGTSWSIPGKPSLMRRLLLMLTSMGLGRDPDQFLSRSMDTMSKPDSQLLAQPERANAFVSGLQEAFQSGIGGANQEAALYAKPWDFRLQDISVPVHLWHGELDQNVPVSTGRYVAEAIPDCDASFHDEEGHFTLPHNHIKEILDTLVTNAG